MEKSYQLRLYVSSFLESIPHEPSKLYQMGRLSYLNPKASLIIILILKLLNPNIALNSLHELRNQIGLI